MFKPLRVSRVLRRLFCCSSRRVFLQFMCVLCVVFVYIFLMQDTIGARRRNERRSLENTLPSQCLLPPMKLYPPGIVPEKHPYQVNCSGEQTNWVSSRGGRIRIAEAVRRRWPDLDCSLIPVLRADDYRVYYGEAVTEIRDGESLSSDFFIANCKSSSTGARYQLIHAGISRVDLPPTPPPLPPGALGLNVVIFALDSVSRLSWQRYLPHTRDYFERELGGVTLTHYNIMGDGTTQNLLALLTGHLETELPESRREQKDAKPVDGFPWIWRRFKKLGYVTQWGEDGAKFGTFQFRLSGFQQQPVDHYMRPYYLKLEELYPDKILGCTGSEPGHMVKLNWLEDFMTTYKKERKFSFILHSQLSHEDNKYASAMDEDLMKFINRLKSTGHLDNSMFILLSDHGHRYAKSRNTLQGKYEERLPYISIYLPPSFRTSYAQEYATLLRNKHRLTTPMDLYETMLDIIDMGHKRETSHGNSLFRDISTERTCVDAAVEPHWCACLQWTVLSVRLPLVTQLAKSLTAHMRNLTAHVKFCAPLQLHRVVTAEVYEPPEDVLHFKASLDKDGRVPDMSDKMAAPYQLYRITIETQPNEGLYEATIRRDTSGKVYFNNKDISRINAIGNKAECISKQYPHLIKFCYCTGN